MFLRYNIILGFFLDFGDFNMVIVILIEVSVFSIRVFYFIIILVDFS